VDLKIDGFFYFDFQRIARMRFSQPLRGAYILSRVVVWSGWNPTDRRHEVELRASAVGQTTWRRLEAMIVYALLSSLF